MFANGVAIAGTITITAHPVTEVLGKLPDLMTVCSAEVRGTSMRSIAAVPTAAGTRGAVRTGVAVFALRFLSIRALFVRFLGFRVFGFRHFGFCLRGLFFSSL